jgi:hypothetical protein
MHQRSTTDKESNNVTIFVPSFYYSTFDRYNNFRNLILNHSLQLFWLLLQAQGEVFIFTLEVARVEKYTAKNIIIQVRQQTQQYI